MENKNSLTGKKPVCCGGEMYACGGVLGKNPETHWRCEICLQETHDILHEEQKIKILNKFSINPNPR